MTKPDITRGAGAAEGAARVRSAGPGDTQALLAMRCALWPERELQRHEHELRLRAQARARHETLIIEDAAGRPCGFAELTRELQEPGQPGRVAVQALFVSPPSRRQGAAARLIEAAERWAHGRGATRLVCEFEAGDARAREALGWLGFAEPEERVLVSRSVSAPIEVAPAAAAPALAAEPVLVVRPARSPAFLLVNLVLLVAAIVSFAYSDFTASDVVRGGVLPLLDAAFVMYFLFLFAMLRYRRRADSSTRAGQLFRD